MCHIFIYELKFPDFAISFKSIMFAPEVQSTISTSIKFTKSKSFCLHFKIILDFLKISNDCNLRVSAFYLSAMSALFIRFYLRTRKPNIYALLSLLVSSLRRGISFITKREKKKWRGITTMSESWMFSLKAGSRDLLVRTLYE